MPQVPSPPSRWGVLSLFMLDLQPPFFFPTPPGGGGTRGVCQRRRELRIRLPGQFGVLFAGMRVPVGPEWQTDAGGHH